MLLVALVSVSVRAQQRGAVGGGEARVVLSLIHISEPTRRRGISYAVFCLKKKKRKEKEEVRRGGGGGGGVFFFF